MDCYFFSLIITKHIKVSPSSDTGFVSASEKKMQKVSPLFSQPNKDIYKSFLVHPLLSSSPMSTKLKALPLPFLNIQLFIFKCNLVLKLLCFPCYAMWYWFPDFTPSSWLLYNAKLPLCPLFILPLSNPPLPGWISDSTKFGFFHIEKTSDWQIFFFMA